MTVSTVHAAKGLEWPAVLVARLSEPEYPTASPLATPRRVEEARRLAYVALSRARSHLAVTFPAADAAAFVRELAAGAADAVVHVPVGYPADPGGGGHVQG